MAVLEKRRGFCLGNQDAFVNVVGGMRLTEPAVDLGVVVAVASSYLDKIVDPDIVVMGEVGLTGEIRNISQLEKRLTEAQKLGFKKCIIPKNNAYTQGTYKGMEVFPVSSIGEAIEIAMGGV
jgi:DNA repair protein RadA/Sms